MDDTLNLAFPISGNEILVLGNKKSHTFDIRAGRFTLESETKFNAEHGGVIVFDEPGHHVRACIFSDFGDPAIVEYSLDSQAFTTLSKLSKIQDEVKSQLEMRMMPSTLSQEETELLKNAGPGTIPQSILHLH